MIANKFRLGEVLGAIAVPADAVRRSAVMAVEFHRNAEAEDFAGEPVETAAVPQWLPAAPSWFPVAAVRELGLEPLFKSSGNELVLTLGVDQHVDDCYGLLFAWVLHNDGLKFKQAGRAYTPKAGDWFVFDDRKPHGVSSGRGPDVMVAWLIPLQAAG